MKPNKEIKKELIQAGKDTKMRYDIICEDYIKSLRLARSVEKIMIAKKRLLMSIVGNLPLGISNCYFCLLKSVRNLGFTCETCQYAKYHGDCGDENGDYHKIQSLNTELRKVVMEYYRNEKYKNIESTETPTF